MLLSLLILATMATAPWESPNHVVYVTWDDPDNRVGTVKGYNVYERINTGTGTIIFQLLNDELIPWVPDTEDKPQFILPKIYPGMTTTVTAVGYNGEESEHADPWSAPWLPLKVKSFKIKEPQAPLP